MANGYYSPTGNPGTGSEGLSALMRGEFLAISTGFDLLPVVAGNGGKVVVVNPGGTALTITVGTLALAGNLSTTGAFNTTFVQGASVTLTLPLINGTLATTANVATETTRATAAEGTNATAITAEATARTAADAAEVTARNTAIGVETTRATAAEGTNATAITAEATARIAADAAEVTARNTAIGVETTRATAAEALLAPKASPTLTGVPLAPTAAPGTNTTQLATTAFDTAAVAVETAARILADAALASIAGQLFGLTLSNDGGTPNTVLDVAAGTCADSTNAAKITLGAFTKSVAGNWVAGTGNNGMGVGLTVALNTWYHVFAVIVAGVADVYFDTSVTAANKPASTTAFRRIGSFLTDGSVHIVPFVQNGDRFDLLTPFASFGGGTPGVITAQTLALATPAGIVTEAILTGVIGDNTSVSIMYISALYQTDIAPSAAAITAETNPPSLGVTALSGFYVRVFTNTSSQIRWRLSSVTTSLIILTNGWIDARGK